MLMGWETVFTSQETECVFAQWIATINVLLSWFPAIDGNGMVGILTFDFYDTATNTT